MIDTLCCRGKSPALAMALLLLAAAPASPAPEAIPLDLAAGAAGRRLPFDVPFFLEGAAPPGTSRVEMRLRVERPSSRGFDARPPAAPLVSSADAAGRFRLAVPALPADRDVLFDLVLERGLTEAGRRLFRQDAEALLRRELAPGRSGVNAVDERLRDGLRSAYLRALGEGRGGGAARGELRLVSPRALFDLEAGPDQVADDVVQLTREVRAARSELEAAIRRHEETAPSLAAALGEIGQGDVLAALLAVLEARPELDPRHPRSPLALSDDARALARDEAPPPARILEGGPAEVAAAREAHRRLARALRELRDWTQALVVAGGARRSYLDRLLETRALSAERVQALVGLQESDVIRRAASWADVLEDHAAEAERAHAVADRALAAMLADLEAGAAAVAVREHVTATGTTAAGLYVSLDLGLLYGFEVERGGLYAGVNVYLAPVNKDAPLRGAGIRKRLSVTLGLTLTDMQQEDDERFENLISERWNLIAGLGLRVTRSVRVGAGVLLVLKNDPNPLVVDRSLGAVPYVSVSLDLDVARLFAGGER